MMRNPDTFIRHMFEIAEKAIEADGLDLDAFVKKDALRQAYADFKESIGIKRIERDTREWDGMMKATADEHQISEDAKRRAKNAKRRLESAIDRYRKAVLTDLGGTA